MNRIEGNWLKYRNQVIPPFAPDVQVTESRRAFYAGAAALLDSIMTMLDPGVEPTEADLKKMDEISNELTEFAQDVRAHRA